MSIDDVFESRKKTGLTNFIVQGLLQPLVNLWFNVDYNVEAKTYDLLKSGEQSVIFLPNHRYMADIPLTALPLQKYFDIQSYYIMKASLPSFFELTGGVSIIRPEDIKGITSNIEMVRKAKERDNEVYSNIIPSILSSGQSVVMYSESTRLKNNPAEFSFSPSYQKKFSKVEDALGDRITFVPVSICYTNGTKFRSEVNVNFANPVCVSVKDNFPILKEKLEYSINIGLKNQR